MKRGEKRFRTERTNQLYTALHGKETTNVTGVRQRVQWNNERIKRQQFRHIAPFHRPFPRRAEHVKWFMVLL